MVRGLYALLFGVVPREVHAWYLAVYLDAVDGVELPSTPGMSQIADGGPMASKPYAATGSTSSAWAATAAAAGSARASAPARGACPFTTPHWDLLLRHQARFASHPRMALQVKNLARIDAAGRRTIRLRAEALRRGEVSGVEGPGWICGMARVSAGAEGSTGEWGRG